ncbi:hypothetical protein EIG11_25910 [Escherichia coli]|nr:hypothetical protein [Escherichia coli]OTE63098.1 hypothetical protein AW120_24580 [Escherichia coli]
MHTGGPLKNLGETTGTDVYRIEVVRSNISCHHHKMAHHIPNANLAHDEQTEGSAGLLDNYTR